METKSIQDDIKEIINKKNTGKKRINSIKKGKTWERTVAKLLTDSLGIKITRVPMSGGYGFIHNSDTFTGDLMAENKNDFMPFNIEAKHYKELNILDVLKTNLKNNKIFEWIEQCERDSARNGKIPLIIFRLNNSPIYVMSKMINFRKRDDESSYLKDERRKILFFYLKCPYVITPIENFNIKEMYDDLKSDPK